MRPLGQDANSPVLVLQTAEITVGSRGARRSNQEVARAPVSGTNHSCSCSPVAPPKLPAPPPARRVLERTPAQGPEGARQVCKQKRFHALFKSALGEWEKNSRFSKNEKASPTVPSLSLQRPHFHKRTGLIGLFPLNYFLTIQAVARAGRLSLPHLSFQLLGFLSEQWQWRRGLSSPGPRRRSAPLRPGARAGLRLCSPGQTAALSSSRLPFLCHLNFNLVVTLPALIPDSKAGR